MQPSKNRFLMPLFCFIFFSGCSYTETLLISGPTIGVRLQDLDNHRIELGEIALHVQPRNEVKIRDSTNLWIIPVSNTDMRVSKGSPFDVDFFVLAQAGGYTFVPSKIQLVVNEKMPVSPNDISGPLDRTKYYGGALVHAIRHTTGMIECVTGTDSFVGADVNHSIAIGDVQKWMCYKLFFDIEPPNPEDRVFVLISGFKKSDQLINVPLLPFEKRMTYRNSSIM